MENSKPALLRPRDAMTRLGIGSTKFWELVQNGELEAKKLGRATVVTEAAVCAFIAKLPSTKRRGPGRPRKGSTSAVAA